MHVIKDMTVLLLLFHHSRKTNRKIKDKSLKFDALATSSVLNESIDELTIVRGYPTLHRLYTQQLFIFKFRF